MNRFSKFIAIILTVVMLASTLPFTFAENSEQNVNRAVNEDYENYLANEKADLSETYVEGEILFNYTSDASSKSASLKSITKDFGLQVLETIDQSALNSLTKSASVNETETLYRASFDSEDISVYELCKAMNELPNISDCEPNYTYEKCDTFVMPTEISSSSQYKSMQKWYFDKMNIPETWQTYSTLGEGEVVCVIDCGLNYTHNEIKNRLWSDGAGNHGYNAEFNNNDIYGQESGGPAHGSHCAGIIAMEGSNGGLVGVAPKAQIMVCNAVTASKGTFTNANLIKSLEYAIDNGADIISMSLGGYAFSFNLDKALTRASFGAVVCCAAGNESTNASERLHWPSACGAVIGVMALGSGSTASTLSTYSNYDLTGRYYQVAAPGTDIYAIDATTTTGYTRMSGTSMATPYMAGICALYASIHKNMSPTQIRNALVTGEGDMIKGYESDAQKYSFKRVTPETLLAYTGDAPVNVTINDSILNTKVREMLGVNNSYQLTNYDLQCVSHIDLSSTSFSNYAELSKLTRLTQIDLSDTDLTNDKASQVISNLAPTTLVIDFSHNKLTNLNFMRDYDSYLSRVSFSNNEITDISGIANFTSLSELDISYNKIKDISPVSSLTGLVYFYAPANEISNPTPILGLNMLEEVYFGNYNPNLADMFGELFFTSGNGGNKIKSLAPFTKISVYSSRIHYLNLSYNYIRKDREYNTNAAKIMQILDQIGTRTNANNNNPFSQSKSKFVLLPDAEGTGDLENGDITFVDEKNFATLSLSDSSYKIPSVCQDKIQYSADNSNIVYVSEDGTVYPRNAGYTYITLKSDSDVKTFFINVKDSWVKGARILDDSSYYAVAEEYKALIYTSNTSKIKLMIGDNILDEYQVEDYGVKLKDKNGNDYVRWIVPFSYAQAGNHEIQVFAYSDKTSSYSDHYGSFNIRLSSDSGNKVSGVIAGYNSRFNAKLTIYTTDGDFVQSTTISGLIKAKYFKFTNIPDGTYNIKIEKDGCKDFYMLNVVVNSDIFLDDDIDLSSTAGDINSDQQIDIADISEVLLADNYSNGTSNASNICCDLDGDDCISMSDISIILGNYSK